MFLSAVQPFSLGLYWLRSQAFRWIEYYGWLYGTIDGHLVKVCNSRGGMEFHGKAPEESLESHIRRYFRLAQGRVVPAGLVCPPGRVAERGPLVDRSGGGHGG